jgi:hypothetical protein
MPGSVIFVHGTGVRLRAYKASIATIRARIGAAGISEPVIECAWGDPFGSLFVGRSLPDYYSDAAVEKDALELAQWARLFEYPLSELEKLSIRGAAAGLPAMPGQKPVWLKDLERISLYKPSTEFDQLLRRAGLREYWNDAWPRIIGSPLVRPAFERSAQANELADCVGALARAVVAQLHIKAVADGQPGPSAQMRDLLCQRLRSDWGYEVLGLGTFLSEIIKRAGTSVIRNRRSAINETIAAPIGDILLYQSRGQEIRDFIRSKVDAAPAPVTLVSHSLGGVACVDLLAMPDPPQVAALVTMGSQAPYFYEMDALASVKAPNSLPTEFPPWLNIYDRDDFLSFVGTRIFPGRVQDFEVRSGQPFPDSHSAYVGNDAVWGEIRKFISQ